MKISLVYRYHNKIHIKSIEIIRGSRIADLTDLIKKEYLNELNLTKIYFGVYGKVLSSNYQLKDGDRLEIYEDALKTPKEYRKEKAKNLVR
tara:strand:- start:427 stop:699 length:273 start_codon:yes stop_codon:yes gene_type:complete